MNTIIFIIEIVAVIIALGFGTMWINDPEGPYEPITFMALLIGTTIIEIVRRRLSVSSEESTSNEIKKLSDNVERLLEQRNKYEVERDLINNEQHLSIEIDSDISDPANERIYELLTARKNVLKKLENFSVVKGIDFDSSQPLEELKKFSFPLAFSDGIVEVLQYTQDMTQHDLVDLHHSEWVDGLALSICDFIDHLIENIKNA